MDERTAGCRERGRQVVRSQQGKLMWAAEFQIVPQEWSFFCHKLLFFSNRRSCLQKKLPKMNSAGGRLPLLRRRSDGGCLLPPTPPKNTLSFISQDPTLVYVSERKAKRACSLATYDEYFNLFSSFQSNFISKKYQISELITLHVCCRVIWSLFDPRMHKL